MKSHRKGLYRASIFEKELMEKYGHWIGPINEFMKHLSNLNTTHGDVIREIPNSGLQYKIMNYNPYTTRKVPKL